MKDFFKNEAVQAVLGSILLIGGFIGFAAYVNYPLAGDDLRERSLTACEKSHVAESLKSKSPVSGKDLRNYRQLCDQQEAIK